MNQYISGEKTCSCGSSSFEVKPGGQHTGLFCAACNKWQKWLNHDEKLAWKRKVNSQEPIINKVETTDTSTPPWEETDNKAQTWKKELLEMKSNIVRILSEMIGHEQFEPSMGVKLLNAGSNLLEVADKIEGE